MRYVVNKTAQPNGDHEVHTQDCRYCPARENRIELGDFTSCQGAVAAARQHYSRSDGCATCSAPCHRQ